MCVRSDAGPNHIIKNLLSQLMESDIVLAVLTDGNPNVCYELGVRHTLKNGTIMILEHGEKIPFDLGEYGIIRYDDTDRNSFQNDLEKFIIKSEKEHEIDNPVKEFFNRRVESVK
jgi:hypothetical protein